MNLMKRRHTMDSGQAVVEFSLTMGLFMLVVGGLIQFGMILWSQNTINQVARDTARWAVTESAVPCDSATSRAEVAVRANSLAGKWSLVAHSPWGPASAIGAVGPSGVGVGWDVIDPPAGMTINPATDCPASDNRLAWVVTVRVNHTVPLFMPGLQFIVGDCAGSGFCISSTAELRMEPKRPQ